MVRALGDGAAALVEWQLQTGRTHQIRLGLKKHIQLCLQLRFVCTFHIQPIGIALISGFEFCRYGHSKTVLIVFER